MASLWVYHANQKPAKLVMSPEVGLMFTVPREIKPFELITTNHDTFTQKNLYAHWTLLFFGFTHCASICPTTLTLMKRIYPDLRAQYHNLQFVFISIDPDRDTLDHLGQYVHSYHPDFIAVTGKTKALHQLQSQLGIYSGQDPASGSSHQQINYQLLHTASMLLIDPQGNWTGIFNEGLKPEELMQGIQSGIQHQESI